MSNVGKVTLAKAIEAFGVKGQKVTTGEEVTTGLRAIAKMPVTDHKLKHALKCLYADLEPRVTGWQEAKQAKYDLATVLALDANGNAQKVRNEQGAMVDFYEVPRPKAMEIGATLKAELKEEIDFPFEKIVWPVMVKKDKDGNETRILPDIEDMALTSDFIDYDKACA